jgi:hypothetical protein
VIGVQDLDAAIARYQSAYGLPAPQRQDDPSFGAKLAWFTGTPVVLAAPFSSRSWLIARLQRFGESPCAFILGARYGVTGDLPTSWFGHAVFWSDPEKLGWYLGFEKK